MMGLSKAWMTLPHKNLMNCFCKCRVSQEAATSAIADDDNPFVRLEEDQKDAAKTLATKLNF